MKNIKAPGAPKKTARKRALPSGIKKRMVINGDGWGLLERMVNAIWKFYGEKGLTSTAAKLLDEFLGASFDKDAIETRKVQATLLSVNIPVPTVDDWPVFEQEETFDWSQSMDQLKRRYGVKKPIKAPPARQIPKKAEYGKLLSESNVRPAAPPELREALVKRYAMPGDKEPYFHED